MDPFSSSSAPTKRCLEAATLRHFQSFILRFSEIDTLASSSTPVTSTAAELLTPISGRTRIRANSIWGFVGFATPAAVNLVAYPVLVHALGDESFGIYVLATSLSATLAFLDLGLSYAIIRFLAEDLGRGDREAATEIIAVAGLFYLVMGVLGGATIWCAAPYLVSLFGVSTGLRHESLIAFHLAGVQFTLSFLLVALISVFKGLHSFHLSAFWRSAATALPTGGAIVGVLLAHLRLVGVMWVGVTGSFIVIILGWFSAFTFCSKNGILPSARLPRSKTLTRMLRFGSALAVSSAVVVLAGPVFRMVIGAALDPQSAGYFFLGLTIPTALQTGLAAFSEPLFPMVAELQASRDWTGLAALYRRYGLLIAGLSSLALVPVILMPEPIFDLWFLGRVPPHVTRVASIIALGMWLNAITIPAYHVLNGIGRSWINAAYTVGNGVLVYLLLGIFFLLYGSNITDFAWATAGSLAISALIFLGWFEANFRMSLG